MDKLLQVVALLVVTLGVSKCQHIAPVAAPISAAPLGYAAGPIAPLPRAVAYARPRPVYAAAPVAKVAVPHLVDPYPQYSFGYSVQDALTGDSHSHTEARDGDVVKGQYQLVETDGSLRTVTYTADPINGFNAVVDRSPAVAAARAPVYAPAAVAQPIPAHYAAVPAAAPVRVAKVRARPAYIG